MTCFIMQCVFVADMQAVDPGEDRDDDEHSVVQPSTSTFQVHSGNQWNSDVSMWCWEQSKFKHKPMASVIKTCGSQLLYNME
jgi:hypothetical protein